MSARPAWVREVDFSLSIHPQVLLTGNVRDLFRMPVPDPRQATYTYVPVGAVLWQVCRDRGYAALGTLDPVTARLGVRSTDGQPPELLRGFTDRVLDVDATAGLLETVVMNPGPPVCLLFPYAARQFPATGLPDSQLLKQLGRIEALGHIAPPTRAPQPPPPGPSGQPEHDTAAGTQVSAAGSAPSGGSQLTPYNTLIWLAERQEDLHQAFPVGSSSLRLIRVPAPTLDDRREAARFALRGRADAASPAGGAHVSEGQDDAMAGRHGAAAGRPDDARDATAGRPVEPGPDALAEVTHGMRVREVFSCGKVAAERRLPPERYGEAARLMRVGITDDPWSADALRDKIKSAETYLNARVLGQERAVAKTLDVLYRSAVGLNGAHLSSSPNRPRGVLFLAGPTGVGKTELAKGIAGLVLGADAEPLRFDMSEFRADEAHQRLIGAPPGYVGYDSGGELTNAVRANPVCVLLFDEIEKAHPRIFDLFLQILEDGRLTDGRGATVHFTESFLIFTSNLGVAEQKPGSDREAGAEAPPPLVNPSMDPREVERVLRRAYEDFFNRGIGRPELRNRFGDSYVVLDFIQKPTVEKIVDKALRTVAARLASVHQAELVVADQVCEELIRYACAKLADGGRGINNVVEAALVNPLSRHIFAHPPLPGAAVELVELRYDDDLGWQLEVR